MNTGGRVTATSKYFRIVETKCEGREDAISV